MELCSNYAGYRRMLSTGRKQSPPWTPSVAQGIGTSNNFIHSHHERVDHPQRSLVAAIDPGSISEGGFSCYREPAALGLGRKNDRGSSGTNTACVPNKRNTSAIQPARSIRRMLDDPHLGHLIVVSGTQRTVWRGPFAYIRERGSSARERQSPASRWNLLACPATLFAA